MRDTDVHPPGALVPPHRADRALHADGALRRDPDARMLRGVVHDPTARRMGGVAGHAGLFSTADDLARFCRMLLGGARWTAARILSPLPVARMTAPSTPAAEPNVRGLGWDIDSSYSANRGELFPIGSFGHTGFTGTSIWIDPATWTYVVFCRTACTPTARATSRRCARGWRHVAAAPRPAAPRPGTRRARCGCARAAAAEAAPAPC